jgi:PLP dependent protein
MVSQTSTLQQIRAELEPFGARLVAVSKTHPEERILDLYEQGQRDFGENRVQELVAKAENLPADIRWHLIGHLQRNKVKYLSAFVHLIQSVDSFRLLREIDKQAGSEERVIGCLLQFKIAQEESKYGFDETTVREMLQSPDFAGLKNVEIQGVMGMATFTDDEAVVRGEFRRLRAIFERLKQDYFADQETFREISMGMSGDYPIALEEGSTIVRIGTLLFGER